MNILPVISNAFNVAAGKPVVRLYSVVDEFDPTHFYTTIKIQGTTDQSYFSSLTIGGANTLFTNDPSVFFLSGTWEWYDTVNRISAAGSYEVAIDSVNYTLTADQGTPESQGAKFGMIIDVFNFGSITPATYP